MYACAMTRVAGVVFERRQCRRRRSVHVVRNRDTAINLHIKKECKYEYTLNRMHEASSPWKARHSPSARRELDISIAFEEADVQKCSVSLKCC